MLVVALAGCGSNGQNVLHPYSRPAKDIASLWWWMLGGSVFGLALVVGLLVAAWARRSRSDPEPGPKPGERKGWIVVIGLGIVMPIAVVASLFVIADIFVIGTTEAPAANSTAMTIDVVGHQWWWEVRYPGTGAVTANEIHIPVGTRVDLVATTADVIHSFWVPELNRKVDTIPGPAQPRPALRGPARRLPGAVHRVLRPPARAHVAARLRAAAGRVQALARP